MLTERRTYQCLKMRAWTKSNFQRLDEEMNALLVLCSRSHLRPTRPSAECDFPNDVEGEKKNREELIV